MPPTYQDGGPMVKQELCREPSGKVTAASLCKVNSANSKRPEQPYPELPRDHSHASAASTMLQLLGEEQFVRVRSLMMAQQRTFVQQLYELHKLNQLQKLLSYEVLGYEQGVGLPAHLQPDTPMPEAYPLPPGQGATCPYPAKLVVAPLTGVCITAQEEVDTSQDGWMGQRLLPQGACLAAVPSQQHHHHHLQYHHHQHHHQHHQHHHAHRGYGHHAKHGTQPQPQQQQQPQQAGFPAAQQSSTPQFPIAPSGKGGAVDDASPGATAPSVGRMGAEAGAAAAAARPALPVDICHLRNIPSALRTKASAGNATSVPGEGDGPAAAAATTAVSAPHSGPLPVHGTAPSTSLLDHSNDGCAGGAAGACRPKPASSWPTTPHLPVAPLVILGGGPGGCSSTGHAVEGLVRPQPCKLPVPVPVVGESSEGKQQQQQLWEQLERQQLGCDSSGVEHSVQQPEASRLNESMASWHALLFDKGDTGARSKEQQQQQQEQQCASAPNLSPLLDSSIALTGPKVRAFRPTQSSPGVLPRLPSSSTLTTDLRCPAQDGAGAAALPPGSRAAATASPLGSGAWTQQQQQQPHAAAPPSQRGAPTMCGDVFATGLYTAAAGGGAWGAPASVFWKGLQPAVEVGNAGAENRVQPAAGPVLRSRHSSPPAAEGGAPQPSNPAAMATSIWRPACPAAAAMLPYPAHQSQQQQQQQQHLMDMTAMGLGLGGCNRPVASAPTHLQHWWGGETSTGGTGAVPSQPHIRGPITRPPLSEGVQMAGVSAAAAAAAASLDLGAARKRTRLDGGRGSYDSAISHQQQQQQQQLQDKPSAFQVVVTRKARSKRGSNNRVSGESVCSDSSHNHQAASRIAVSGNAGYLHNSSRGSLDTIGNCAGSVRSNGGFGSFGLAREVAAADGACAMEESMEGDGGAGFRQPPPHPQQHPHRQRPAPARCLSRTGGNMQACTKGGSEEKSGHGAKRDALALHGSPHRASHPSQQQQQQQQQQAVKDADAVDLGLLPGEGVDQSAAGILLALSSGGTF